MNDKNYKEKKNTEDHIIATVSSQIPAWVERTLGASFSHPLWTCMGVVYALAKVKIQASIIFGYAGWLEILEDQTPWWVGCWDEHHHLWVQTEYHEIVDLSAMYHYLRPGDTLYNLKSSLGPPGLWSSDIPKFYRYLPHGVADMGEVAQYEQQKIFALYAHIDNVMHNIDAMASSTFLDLSFGKHPMVLPQKRLIDNAQQDFSFYDRALQVCGMPSFPQAWKRSG